MTRDRGRRQGVSLAGTSTAIRKTSMNTRKLLMAFALDVCAAAVGVSIIAVPMLFIGAMA